MGILGKQKTISGEDILLYKCPVGRQAVLTVNNVNTGKDVGFINISIVKGADLSVNTITVTQKGTGLVDIPTLTIVGSSTTTATAKVNTISITELNTIVGGSGYKVGDILTLKGGTFTEAAKATVSAIDANGTITAITSITGGVYTSIIEDKDITTTTDSANGTGATFTLTGVRYGILSVNVENRGNGYTTAPTIEVSSGTGFQFNIATTTVVEVTDSIEYNVELLPGAILERTGIILGAGDGVFIKGTTNDIVCVSYGIETLA